MYEVHTIFSINITDKENKNTSAQNEEINFNKFNSFRFYQFYFLIIF